MDLERLLFTRANIENVGELLVIIHRCMNEVNYKDYAPHEFKKYLAGFTADWLIDIINTRHYYEVWYQEKIVACGGVSRDYSQEKQSYFTAIFVNPDYHRKGIGRKLIQFLERDEWCSCSNLIEIPSSKSSHEFYYKCGYKYRNSPPIFSEIDGSTIMYKEITPLAMDIYNVGNRVMNTYIYRASEGCIMIDTGYEHSLKNVEKKADRHGIALSEIKYVFLTHAHDDHAGFLNELLSKYADIKVIISNLAMPTLIRGQNAFDGGCSSLAAFVFCKFMGLIGKGKHLFPAIDKQNIDRFIEISPQNLANIENLLQGKILFTPGHTSDSISLKISNIIFCGDAAMNGLPSLKRITIWIEDKNAFQNSWNILIGEKADWIYPAHGKPFRRDELKKYINHIPGIRLYELH